MFGLAVPTREYSGQVWLDRFDHEPGIRRNLTRFFISRELDQNLILTHIKSPTFQKWVSLIGPPITFNFSMTEDAFSILSIRRADESYWTRALDFVTFFGEFAKDNTLVLIKTAAVVSDVTLLKDLHERKGRKITGEDYGAVYKYLRSTTMSNSQMKSLSGNFFSARPGTTANCLPSGPEVPKSQFFNNND